MINWGIIGCGNVTEIKSGPAFNKISGSRLIAVTRRNKSSLRIMPERHNVPKVHSDSGMILSVIRISMPYMLPLLRAATWNMPLRLLRPASPFILKNRWP